MRFIILKNRKQDTDIELLEKYKDSQDNSYVGELFQRYSHLVFGVCMKYLKDEAASQDAVMQIFEKLLTDLTKHEITNFKSWIYSVTKNHCLMQIRKERAEFNKKEEYKNDFTIKYDYSNERESDYMEITSFLHLNNDPDAIIPGQDKNNDLHDAVMHLNKQQKICIEMFYLHEKSYKEIEALTGYSYKQVKSFVQNGKSNLKKKFLATKFATKTQRHKETKR